MKKFLCLILCVVVLSGALISCSKPPELAEILPRLEELIEASYGVNDLLFGDGPDTYERVYDPSQTAAPYFDENNKLKGYYRYIEDGELGTVLAYKTTTSGSKYDYAQVTSAPNDTEDLIYVDTEKGLYYVKIEYTERTYDFYYTDDIPEDYDVVVMDESNPYQSVASIKSYAQTVYSSDYLNSIYGPMFDGAMVSQDEGGYIKARYSEYTSSEGESWFMFSNTYTPVSTEKRIFDLSSASVGRGSNSKYVNIELDSYLESKPDEVLRITLSLILQDGVWMLDTPTY